MQDERLQTLRAHLHVAGSGAEARRLYPDFVEVFVDRAEGKGHPAAIVPFRYYWSRSGQVTVSICAIERTIFICPYYVAGRIGPLDFGRCLVDQSYLRFEQAPTR